MGLNFGIVIGAMAAQIIIIAVTHWGIVGIPGFLLCILLTTPIAMIFGYFTGKLLNKTKGQEMIASMILGYFANGLYQLLFLFLIGTLIPMNNLVLMISGGVGIKNTVDLTGGIKYALDNIFNRSLYYVVYNMALIALVVCFASIIYSIIKKKKNVKMLIFKAIISFIVFVGCQINSVAILLDDVSVPIGTMVVIAVLCVFNVLIFKTKLGQDFRTIGQNPVVANASGINVDKTRIKAIVISTVSKATNKQAILGVILFHTLFIVSPTAGKNLFNNAQIGEYFRVFVAYGVICVSLVLYAWKDNVKSKEKITL